MKKIKYLATSIFLLLLLDILLTKTYQTFVSFITEKENFIVKNEIYHHELKKKF